jgi:hypothetical protein
VTFDEALARVLIGVITALVLIGAATALVASNAVKRLVGVCLAFLGAIAGAAVMAAPALSLLAVGAVGVAYLALGAAIAVRMHERFASIEASEVDAADSAAETEPRS